MYLSQDALDYVLSAKDELMDLERTLCAIPSPSHQEHRRAAFCKEWLEKAGAKGVYIDEVQNVIFPINAEGTDLSESSEMKVSGLFCCVLPKCEDIVCSNRA